MPCLDCVVVDRWLRALSSARPSLFRVSGTTAEGGLRVGEGGGGHYGAHIPFVWCCCGPSTHCRSSLSVGVSISMCVVLVVDCTSN